MFPASMTDQETQRGKENQNPKGGHEPEKKILTAHPDRNDLDNSVYRVKNESKQQRDIDPPGIMKLRSRAFTEDVRRTGMGKSGQNLRADQQDQSDPAPPVKTPDE